LTQKSTSAGWALATAAGGKKEMLEAQKVKNFQYLVKDAETEDPFSRKRGGVTLPE